MGFTGIKNLVATLFAQAKGFHLPQQNEREIIFTVIAIVYTGTRQSKPAALSKHNMFPRDA